MPATDTSAVQITINVVDGATGETISRVTKSLDQLGDAGSRNGQKLNQGLSEAGRAGESVGPAVGKGMKEAGAHSLSALDNVRLLRDDLGIRIPRAMEKVIAQSSLAMGAIGAIGTGLVALGAIQVLTQLAEQAYKFYERVTDVNAAMRKYSEQAGRNASQKLFETQSIEEVNALLKQTEGILDSIDAKRRSAGVGEDNSGSLMQYVGKAFAAFGAGVTPGQKSFQQMHPAFTDADSQQKAEAQSRKDLLKESTESIEARRAVSLQEDKAAQDALRLTSRAADMAAERNAIILAQLKKTQQMKDAIFRRDSVVSNNALIKRQNPNASPDDLRKIKGYDDVPVVAPDIGAQEANDAIAKARGDAAAKSSRQGQDNAKETRHIVAEAGIAGLDGEPQFLAKKMEALEQLKEKSAELGLSQRDYQARAKAIDDEFYQAQTKRMIEDDARSAELEARANIGGKTGLAKLDAERAAALKKQQDDAAAGKFPNVDSLGRNSAAINKQYNDEGNQQQGSFTDRLSQLDAGRSDRYASEGDRITQSAQKTVAEITKAWTEMYGGLNALDSRRVQSQQALNNEIVKINADAARQRQEAGQRVEDETRKIEDEAARSSLPKYQQETAAIVDDYNERIAKLEELRAKDADNADRYRRQEIAEEQIKNGKLLEQRRQLEDQLAGKLKGLMSDHPLNALKSAGEDQASKFASQAIFQAFPNFSTALAGGSTKKGGGSGPFGLPNVFGSGWGGKHPATFDAGASQAGSGTHNDNPLTATTRDLPGATSTAVVTASSATISIGSATIVGAGAGSRGASGGVVRTASGTYAPTGGGGYFNLGGGSNADAGGPSASSSSVGLGSSSSTTSAGSLPSIGGDAGSGGSIAGTLDAGIGAVGTTASTVQDVGSSAGIWDEAGASAATDASIKGAGGAGGAGSGNAGGAAGGGGGIGAQLGGAASAGLGLFSAIDGKGGFGGALSGAFSGAKLGAMFGGPIGAGVGALVGGALGLFGFGARAQAEKYNNRTVKPRIANDLTSFEAGQTDYQTAFNDLTNLVTEAKIQTRQMGSGALGYYNSTIDPEIKAAQARMTREQKAGRSQFGMTAAQFHQGGIIRDFGSMSTTDGQGWIHAQRGEAVLNQQAAMTHADAAMMMNAGASRSDMASYYGGGGGSMPVSSGGGDVHLHVHAIDTRGVQQFFEQNKHTMRDQLNASYAENSGGGDYA